MARIPERQEIIERLGARLAPRPEVLEAHLFGSQARGDAAAHSDVDVDVAVYVDRERLPPAPYGYAADLATDRISALGTNDVDVVVLNDAPPLLYHRVLRDGIRLLSRGTTFALVGCSRVPLSGEEEGVEVVFGDEPARLAEDGTHRPGIEFSVLRYSEGLAPRRCAALQLDVASPLGHGLEPEPLENRDDFAAREPTKPGHAGARAPG